ncbi:MAG: UDP-N-acetylmuramate:L-alanyl-gamma-D-glutamyl-meso-diaminopimelate ligase, partial [Mariprofundaceae bacterium]|nr:UDP-N-acetylmuramate:L-alanyl-gamma-D-glutamyl-meso-diaminopimelate ligase [Mariprofundaceae bacterium]
QVIFAQPSSRNLAPDEVLDVQSVCAAIGPHAQVLPDAAAIIEELAAKASSGDDILILSNGGFDGIHKRLIERLGRSE